MNFGVNDDRFLVSTLPVAAPEIVEHGAQLYVACVFQGWKEIRIAKLKWAPKAE